MYQRNLLAYCLIVFTILSLRVAAHAAVLEDAVIDYNTQAACLNSLWSSYENSHEAAFDDYVDMMTNFYLYIETNEGEGSETNYYALYETAQSNLLNYTGPALEDDYSDLVTALDGGGHIAGGCALCG